MYIKSLGKVVVLTVLTCSIAHGVLADEAALYGKGNGVVVTEREANIYKDRMVPKEVIPLKREMLRVMLMNRLFAKEAESQILPKDKDLAIELDLLKENRLAKAYSDGYLQKNLKLDDAVLESYYLSHIEDYRTPRQFELSRLIFDSKEKADAAVQQLKGNPNAFFDLVKTSLDPALRLKDGKMSLVKETDLKPEIRNAVSELKENDIAGPVEINGFYYVFKIDKVISESYRPFAEVKKGTSIYDKIISQKRDEVLKKHAEELMKRYGFEWTDLAKQGWDDPVAPISNN